MPHGEGEEDALAHTVDVLQPLPEGEAVPQGEGVGEVLGVLQPLPEGEGVPQGEGEADLLSDAEPLCDTVALLQPLLEGDAVLQGEGGADPLPDGEGEAVAELLLSHRKEVLLHVRPAAHRGAASSVVQAGPRGTALGHHAPAGDTPQDDGTSTAEAAREAKVKAARGAQRAGVAPWQVSVEGAHSRPAPHRVAVRGPE